MTEDYYAMLGVSRTVRADDLRRAYHEMVRRHARGPNPGGAAEKELQRIEAAFEVLSDPQRRAAYDRELGGLHGLGAGAAETAAGNVEDRQRSPLNLEPSRTGPTRTAGSDCPSREQLIAYTLGTLPEETLQGMAAHLETCGGCLATLSTVGEAEDSLVSGLRGLPRKEPFLDEPECEQAVQQFEAVGGVPARGSPPLSARSGKVADLSLPKRLGRYEIVEELGRGGMGTVYLAEDTQLDRQVALKIPHFRAGDKPDFLDRFYREARAAAKIRHANLCPVYDAAEIDGFPCLSMAYIQGKSLAKLIRSKVPFSQREAAEIVRKLALAVQEAHAHGVVHRDIKPSNVIMTEDGEPILTDFGLARGREAEGSELTRGGVIVGTPAYMAPEQVKGDPDAVGPCSDIYSLGVVLYELLTGEVPFRGPLLSVVSQIGKDQPDPPSLRRAGLDCPLEAICIRAMAKDPAARWPSAGEMAAALERYLQALSKATAARPRRRRLIWIAAVAAAAVLLLAAVAVSHLRRGKGILLLAVNEPEVAVAIDGEPVQSQSSDEGILLKAGRHWLEVSKEGFYTYRQSFGVGRGEKTLLPVTLRKRVAVGGSTGGNLLQVLLDPTRDAGDRFGSALAAVGENILVGAPQDDTDAKNAGIAYLFSGSTGQLLRVFHNPNPAADDHFGEVVAAMDQNVLIAAPQSSSGGPGFVCLFDGLSGTLLHCFQHPRPHPGDGFGSSLAPLGNRLFVGAYQDDTVATDAGAVYAFALDGSHWKLHSGFLKHVPRANDCFGCSLAAAGNNLLVGATGDDQRGADAGAVYLFDASTGRKLRTFFSRWPIAGDVFGRSIAAAGDRVLVGAYMDDTGAENAGVAYLFDAATGKLLQTFLNPSPAIDEYFGWSVAVVGNRVLIGAHLEDTGAENAGAAYLLDATSGKVVEQFYNPSPAAHDHFGYCVAAVGHNLLVGSRRAGAVYLFAGPHSGEDPADDRPPALRDQP
jgi:curved DNA-binding protein CbpA/predicted Ser/Thr protein kinase/outer membrane protein assembly factor BamB